MWLTHNCVPNPELPFGSTGLESPLYIGQIMAHSRACGLQQTSVLHTAHSYKTQNTIESMGVSSFLCNFSDFDHSPCGHYELGVGLRYAVTGPHGTPRE